MQYPINYDFGANWKSKIVPYLDDPRIKKSLEVGINHYLSGFPGNQKYQEDTCPANYSSKDGYAMLMDRKCEIYINNLEKEGKLPREYINLKSRLNDNTNNNDYDDDDDDNYNLLFEMEEEITSPLYKWENIKYDIESYFLSGSCHSYAPTFELTLARIIEPEEKWLVRTSNKHSTVINDKKTKIFDLLYWCCFGDINKYLFGDEIKDPDYTLGGKDAYIDSLGKSSIEVISFEDFERKIKANKFFEIIILDDLVIPCYPDNVIILLKGNRKRYLMEARYDKSAGEMSAPIY